MLKPRAVYFILAMACLLVYGNSLNNAFVSDDIPAILNNPGIKNTLSFWSEPQSFLNSLIYNFAGFKVFPYHLANLILHLINTILVFALLSLFFKTQASFLGALLFAVHPAHAEAVSWISGRSYLTLTFFLLVSYLSYYKSTYQGKFKPWFYFLSLGGFSYYLIGNFTFITLFPVLIIISDIIFKRWRQNWKLWVPFLSLAILRILLIGELLPQRITYVTNYLGNEVVWRNPIPPFIYSIFSHLWILIWPEKLTFYYEPVVFYPLAVWIGFSILAISACFLPYLFKKSKIIFLGTAIFILFLAPTYSPFPVATLVAERYAYFPSIFLSILAAFFYQKYSEKEGKGMRRLGTVLLIFIIGLYAGRTIIRNADWKDGRSLFAATLKVYPDSPSAHNGMGAVYFHDEDIERAIAEFTRAIELKSNYAMAYCNRGVAYYNKGDLSRAISDFSTAIKLKADYAEAYHSRAVAYFSSQEYLKSRDDVRKLEELGYQVNSRFLNDLKESSAKK